MACRLESEHLLLGGLLAGADEVPQAASYGDPRQEGKAFAEGVALVDLDGMYAQLFAGVAAPSFAQAAFAGRELAVGECAFEASLLGDGAVASVALLARTGDAEYVAWDLSPRSSVLDGWLAFLANVEQGGVRPYEGLETEDVEDAFVPLLLAGPAAPDVLADYLGSQPLPAPGSVASLRLDRIACVVVAPELGKVPAYLVLVPPRSARVLWRSFLSFPVVTPVGGVVFRTWLDVALPWHASLSGEGERLSIPAARLRKFGLVRAGDGFVGARGLASQA